MAASLWFGFVFGADYARARAPPPAREDGANGAALDTRDRSFDAERHSL
jgi:hypothetical protein